MRFSLCAKGRNWVCIWQKEISKHFEESAVSLWIDKLITSLMAFLLAITQDEMSKDRDKAGSLSCLWHNMLFLIVDQPYKPEEMRKTIALCSEHTNCWATHVLQGFILLSASCCSGLFHPGAKQDSQLRYLTASRFSCVARLQGWRTPKEECGKSKVPRSKRAWAWESKALLILFSFLFSFYWRRGGGCSHFL